MVNAHPAFRHHLLQIAIRSALSLPKSPYLNNVAEQDHRFIKKRIIASLGFRSAEAACRTIEGYEAMHTIRKGQVRWLAKGHAVGQRQFIHTLFGKAA
jgi:transposase-like protein